MVVPLLTAAIPRATGKVERDAFDRGGTMKSWSQLESTANRLSIEIQMRSKIEVSLVDVGSLKPLVTLTIGDLDPVDHDHVLRAATSAALAMIRRRGA